MFFQYVRKVKIKRVPLISVTKPVHVLQQERRILSIVQESGKGDKIRVPVISSLVFCEVAMTPWLKRAESDTHVRDFFLISCVQRLFTTSFYIHLT